MLPADSAEEGGMFGKCVLFVMATAVSVVAPASAQNSGDDGTVVVPAPDASGQASSCTLVCIEYRTVNGKTVCTVQKQVCQDPGQKKSPPAAASGSRG